MEPSAAASSPSRRYGNMVNIELSPNKRGAAMNSSAKAHEGVSPSSSASSSSRAATPSPVHRDGPGAKAAGASTLQQQRQRKRASTGGAGSGASSYTVALLAAIMGNVLEFYDFSVYAFFAPEIGKLFFPKGSPAVRAVETFTVFAGGFLMRPVGSVLLGFIGDKYGTAAALKWSIALMTIPTVLTGCLPTYLSVGLAAPILLTICRLLQGLSVGGELVGALLHTSDHCPNGRRGFFCGLVAVFGSCGNLLGSLVSVSMRHALTDEQLMSWGWRLPFLTGSLLGVVGIFLRTQTGGLRHNEEAGEEHEPLHLRTSHDAASLAELMVETPAAVEEERAHEYHLHHHHDDAAAGASPAGASACAHGKQHPHSPQPHEHQHASFWGVMKAAAGADKLRFLEVVVVAALNNAHFYFQFVWLGTYLAQLSPHPIPASQAFSVTCVAQVCLILTSPLWGWAGDYFAGPEKRVRFILAGAVLGAVVPPALFHLLQPGDPRLCFAYAVAAGLTMGFAMSGNYYAWCCETLHDSPARFMTTSVAYNLGAITGGAYPMLASALAESKVAVAPVLPSTFAAVAVFLFLVYTQHYLNRHGSSGGSSGGSSSSSAGFASLSVREEGVSRGSTGLELTEVTVPLASGAGGAARDRVRVLEA